MSDSDLNADIAIKLLRHLEWQAEGFSIIFFFADIGPADEVFSWLNDRLIIGGTQLRKQKIEESFANDPEYFVEDFISQLSAISKNSGGIWYELHGYPGDAQWDKSRRKFLARLNERRFLLEKTLERPLVIVLPADFRADTRGIAPDIWHIRALSEELRAEVSILTDDDSSGLFPEDVPVVLNTPSYVEWQRIRGSASGKEVLLSTLFAAVDELIAAKRALEAEKVAKEGVRIAYSRVHMLPDENPIKTAGTLSGKSDNTKDKNNRKILDNPALNPLQMGNDFFVSLLKLGDAFEALGKIDDASESFLSALVLIRNINSISENNLIRTNLGVLLSKLGDFENRRGKFVEAERYLRESISVLKSLRAKDRKDDIIERSIGAALFDLGTVLRRQGIFLDAVEVYKENVAVRHSLAEASTSPADRRQVAIALANVGRTELARGETSNAEKYLGESLAIFRKLEKDRNASSQSLRDLSISLRTLAQISQVRGDLDQANKRFGEARDISWQLVERDGRDSPALRDLQISTQDLGAIAMNLGDFDQARNLCQKSLEIAKLVGDQAGWTIENLSDATLALKRLADVEKKDGNWAEAKKLLKESIKLGRNCVEQDSDLVSSSRQLASLISDLGEISLRDSEPEDAESLYEEAAEIQRKLLKHQRFPMYLRDYSRCLIELARIASSQGNYIKSEAVSREAVEIRRELLESSSDSPSLLRQLSVSLNFLVNSLIGQERYVEAEKACLEGLSIDRKLVETQGETVRTLKDLRISLETLIIIASHDNEFDRLKKLHVEVLKLGRKLVELQPGLLTPLEELAESLQELADALEIKDGHTDEQVSILEEGIEICKNIKYLSKGKEIKAFDLDSALMKLSKFKK